MSKPGAPKRRSGQMEIFKGQKKKKNMRESTRKS